MRKLSAFSFITLNGFFKGPNEDIRWHQHGGEEAQFSEKALAQDNILLFGRRTYEMMVAFWPTPVAQASFPRVAAGMNQADKLVFSRTMRDASWNNTRVVNDHITAAIRKLKRTAGKDMTILGSGSIVVQMAEEGLIDEYQIMVDPVVIGTGTPLFDGIKQTLGLKLTTARTFKKSGVVLLCYQPGPRGIGNARRKTAD